MNARTPCGSPSVTLAPRLVGRQGGATLVFTALFTLAVAAAAFSVFGLGQSIWQRENMQRIADLSESDPPTVGTLRGSWEAPELSI